MVSLTSPLSPSKLLSIELKYRLECVATGSILGRGYGYNRFREGRRGMLVTRKSVASVVYFCHAPFECDDENLYFSYTHTYYFYLHFLNIEEPTMISPYDRFFSRPKLILCRKLKDICTRI